MNRRFFLKAVATAAAVIAAPIAWVRTRLKLRGDGVTDDTEAIQALADGEPVEMPDGSIQQIGTDGVIHLPAGRFNISRIPNGTTLRGTGGRSTTIKRAS